MATPTIFARGKYEVKAPFTLVANTSYTCIDIRSFRSVEAEGINILQTYYLPQGLTQADYDSDRVNAVTLVTLAGEEVPEIVIPSSYITSFPLTVGDGFSRMVIGVDIGVLPDSLDISYLTAEIKNLVSDLTGLQGEVTLFSAPITGVLTPEEAQAFEDNRKAAIASRSTFYAQNKRLNDQLAEVTAIKDAYEKIIIDNGLVT